MPLSFLLDENQRGPLWKAIFFHNLTGINLVDAVRVGDLPDLPLGSLDPDILLWAEREGRILVTKDKDSMSAHLADHLQSGHHSPGVFSIRKRSSLPLVVSFLAAAAYES